MQKVNSFLNQVLIAAIGLLLIFLAITALPSWLAEPHPSTQVISASEPAQIEAEASPIQHVDPVAPTPADISSVAAPAPAQEHSVLGASSIDAATIDRVLAEYGSPAEGTGQLWIEIGKRYGIDPAYALAFFIHESSAGTNPNWAGIKPDGTTTHNIGNIICAGYDSCFGRFRDYPNWQTGIEDWYALIKVEYVEGRGVHTVEQIIPIYAPASENNVALYIKVINRLVDSWRQHK